ncbi:EAL domain-containing protein [Congregibacter variabilis]|uniref:EAL domain-containing protein n=1 Tax=Congregibacter variabilis TaxID=3081200 RepID=A0ABZ0I1V0_9GAMM|nr:EAL domain-containing protein [Congregibacter sp. IMCC43200]
MTAEAEVPDDLKHRVFLERLNIFYESLSVSVFAVVLNTLLLGYLLWRPENSQAVVVWCSATLAIAAYRIITTIRYRRSSEAQREAKASAWYREMMAGVVLSGLAWGAAGFLLYDSQNMLNHSLLAFVIAGMCTGSIVSLSAFFEASVVYLATSLLPFMVRLIGEGSPETNVMAFMVVLYLFMMTAFARRVNLTVIAGLEMTYLRSRAEDTIERQALFDDLTGLPNRRLLQDRLGQALARAKRNETQAALLFLDLDFFKRVNDSLGHSAGDQLLVEVGRRLSDFLRDADTAARLGGDEFVALLTDIEGGTEHVVSVVRRRGEALRRAIEAPIDIQGNEIHITVSIGVSLLPDDTNDVDDLLKHADTAMYRAKDDGRNTLRFFVPEMQASLSQRMDMERQLRAALEADEGLELYLQPQYTEESIICGAELLLRWQHNGAFVPPDVFIPVAEDSGLIYRLGDWVIKNACEIGEGLKDELSDREFSLALNVSPRQFRQKGFSEKVLEAIESHQLPRGLIELELTEGLLIEDVDDTVAKMLLLREQGVRFSIDDFGTGYSSLRYLKSLPLDTLKVDQSFVQDVLTDPGDASIVRAIISMAQTLELEVIAEGVETEAVRDFLISANCVRFQGYLYSRPVPLNDFRALLAREREQIIT